MQTSHFLSRRFAFVSLSAALLAGVFFLFGPRLAASADPQDEEFEMLIANPAASTGSCGVERWSVKTGTDADIGLVNLSATSANTVAAMAGWPTPSPIPANNRIAPYETTVWQLTGTLTSYKLESDSDYHLVLIDTTGHSMIVEIPDPACVASTSPLRAKITNARAQFDAKYTATGSFQTANVPVTVTGIGMFDFLHGQTGVAPNGIELHSVLNVNFSPGSTYSISGSVTNASGAALSGIAIAAGGVSTTSSSTGAYTLGGLAGGSYTVTPSSANYTFTPSSRAVSIAGASVTGQNFVGNTVTTSTYAITGMITAGGTALSGVTMSYSGASSGSATSDTSGNYSLNSLAAGSYTLTPAKSGYAFTPATATISVGPSAVQNFTAAATGGTALSNGVAVNSSVNGASADASFKDFTLAVPSGASNLTIATTNASGDVDLYVRAGAAPTLSTYDCRPYTSSGNESCSFASPAVTTYFIRVYNYATGPLTFSLTGTYSTGGTTATEKLVNGGFESGATAWTAAGTASITYAGTYPRTGVGYSDLCYNTNSATGSVLQTVTIPATATSATLSLWVNIVTQESTSGTTAYDSLNIKLRTSTGGSLKTLATYSNVNNIDNTNTAGKYVKHSYDVSAYKGQTIQVYFSCATDTTLPTVFRLDDVSLMSN